MNMRQGSIQRRRMGVMAFQIIRNSAVQQLSRLTSKKTSTPTDLHIDDFVQDCGDIANALELLQSCTKPSVCALFK